LRGDLPLIDDGVTVEHLLAHRSGIGDYLDEETVAPPTEFVMPVPVHVLASTEAYLGVLAGYRQVFAPGERFAFWHLLKENMTIAVTWNDDVIDTDGGIFQRLVRAAN
jgi:CubicO group peptidase (beta-lactamase class C family)